MQSFVMKAKNMNGKEYHGLLKRPHMSMALWTNYCWFYRDIL